MTDLQMFLLDNNVTELKKDIIISDRLKDKPFTIKCISGTDMEAYQKQCITNASNPKKRKIDTAKFNELIIFNHCINPNFKDAEWLAQAGCPTDPRALLNKCLTAGEILKLSSEIQKLSGFGDEEQQELTEEVKNA